MSEKHLPKQEKRLDAVLSTVEFIQTHGVDHEGLCGVMGTHDHFLAMDTASEVQLPGYLSLHRNLHTIRKCSSPEDFWRKTAYLSCVFLEGQVSAKQRPLIAARCISITKEENMLSVLRAFAPKALPPHPLHESIMKQLHDVRSVLWLEECTSGTLKAHCNEAVAALVNVGTQKDYVMYCCWLRCRLGETLSLKSRPFCEEGCMHGRAGDQGSEPIDARKGQLSSLDGEGAAGGFQEVGRVQDYR